MSKPSCSIVVLLSLWPFHLIAAPFPALVDGAWLAHNKADVVVLDVRPRAEYRRGHWPGARWAGFNAFAWQVERYGLPGYLPGKQKLSVLLGSLGLKGSESVVVSGSAMHPLQVAEAARVVWSLMMAGFERVALLDGGIESLPGHVLVRQETLISSTSCIIELRQELLADTNYVEGLLDDNGIVVDFRPTPYFDGVKRDPVVSKPGTILEARGFPPERLLDGGNGRFLRPETIQQALERYGIPASGLVVTFSNTGIWAALGWFVLHRILDNPQTRLYDGSLVEWIDWGGEVYDSTDDMGGPIG